MEYYSVIKRNAFKSVLMRWMNLEPIIQSELSQKEKDKYRILTHIYKSRKILLMNLLARQQERNRHHRLMDMGRWEESMRCMERVTWKLTLPYVK